MPVQRAADFILNGKPYMLSRNTTKGRAWHRTGQSDAPNSRSPGSLPYGTLPAEVDYVEVWDDWSGGFGHAYRRYGENTYHWAEGFDARFPRQLVHAQALRQLATGLGSLGEAQLQIHDASVPSWFPGSTGEKATAGVIVLKGVNAQGVIRPQADLSATPFETISITNTTGQSFGHGKPALFGSYYYYPFAHATWSFWQSAVDNLVGGSAAPQYQPAQGFAVAGNRLWRYFGYQFHPNALNSVAAGANPMATANWSATLNVGNGFSPISDMISREDQLFVGLPDGLYVGDQSGSFVNVLGELSGQVNSDNCRDLTIHNGAVIVPTLAGLFSYENNGLVARVSQILPNQMSNRSPVHGTVKAVKSYGGWLYAGLYTGSQSYLLAGQERDRGGFAWHTLNVLPHYAKFHRIHFDGISTATGGTPIPNRLWVLTEASVDTGATCPVYWQPIPALNGNPLMTDTLFSANFVNSARIDLGAVDWGAPSTPKVYRAFEVWADNLASGSRWCDVYYSIDSEATRHLLGTSAKSPKDILYFSSGTGSFVTGQSIEMSIDSRQSGNTISPVYRAFVLRGMLRPRSVDTITAMVRIGDNVRDRQGTTLRSGATMLAELRALATSANPVQLVDLTGATNYVAVIPPIEEIEVYQQGQTDPEVAATIKMVVEAFS